jgi:hypothetical protein
MARYLYSELAHLVSARRNCEKTGSTEWRDKHEDSIGNLCREYLPSGSGFDAGSHIDLDASHAEKLVFTTSYHHMNNGGYYDGWTEHTVTVTPSFIGGFNIRVSGRNQNDIKGYIAESFSYVLQMEVTR